MNRYSRKACVEAWRAVKIEARKKNSPTLGPMNPAAYAGMLLEQHGNDEWMAIQASPIDPWFDRVRRILWGIREREKESA